MEGHYAFAGERLPPFGFKILPLGGGRKAATHDQGRRNPNVSKFVEVFKATILMLLLRPPPHSVKAISFRSLAAGVSSLTRPTSCLDIASLKSRFVKRTKTCRVAASFDRSSKTGEIRDGRGCRIAPAGFSGRAAAIRVAISPRRHEGPARQMASSGRAPQGPAGQMASSSRA